MNSLYVLFGLTASIYGSIDIFSDHIGNVFMDNEPVSLRLQSTSEVVVSIKNYEGSLVLYKAYSAGESRIEIPVLSRSHYIVTAQGGNETKEAYFAVLPSMDSRVNIDDSNIASDLATSWLVKPEKFESLAKLTKMAGIIWTRDRLRWGEIQPERDKWQEHGRYDLSAEAQTNQGLMVYQVFHDTPEWARNNGTSKSMPDDLRDIYNFAAEMARRFKGKVKAWEVWNEPDIIYFSDELGDSYSAMLKAMYLGFKSVDPELPVLICSFAMEPGPFAEHIFQNDVKNYFDIYNYHIYDKWENHRIKADKHIQLMKKYGVEDKPIWLTEAGHAVRRLPDLVELTPDQGREVAEYVPKAIITSLAAGVDKYFWFILPYYRENDFMLFGLLRGDMTPTAGYCALATCTYALGKAEYIGKLEFYDMNVHAFYRGDNTIAIAFWTNSGNKVLRLNTYIQKVRLVSLMGSEQEIETQSGVLELKATPSVNYVILPSDTLRDNLTISQPRPEPVIKPFNPDQVSPFVLRLQFPRETRDKKTDLYMLSKDSPTSVGIEIYNFGKDPGDFKLSVQVPDGWNAHLDDEKFTIEHNERVTRELKLLPDESASSEPGCIRIELIKPSGEAETFIKAWAVLNLDLAK